MVAAWITNLCISTKYSIAADAGTRVGMFLDESQTVGMVSDEDLRSIFSVLPPLALVFAFLEQS